MVCTKGISTISSLASSYLVYSRIRNVRRHYSTKENKNNGTSATSEVHNLYGPKDTLLVLGYSVKETDLESHINALKETLKLKMMTLDFYSEDVAQSHTDLAMVQHQSVQHINEAKVNYLRAYEIWKKIRGYESRQVSNILCLIGVVMRDLGEIVAAESAFRESLAIDRKINDTPSNLNSVYSLNNLAGIEYLKGRFSEACQMYEETIRIMLTATYGDPNHRMIAVFYYNLGCSYAEIPDFQSAETALLRSKEIIATIGDTVHIGDRIHDLLQKVTIKGRRDIVNP